MHDKKPSGSPFGTEGLQSFRLCRLMPALSIAPGSSCRSDPVGTLYQMPLQASTPRKKSSVRTKASRADGTW